MRVFGLLGLVLALLIVGVIAKKQLTTAAAPALPSVPGAASPVPADARTQAQQVQKQVQEALDAAAQARKMPDDN
ncbi:hypothetical protein ABIC94_001113 [Variovorax paradoxus]|uniref:hypothetical protein n=1 Tax=Variovorax paradoxus TaxID=34073 RepID=UPI003391745E